MSRPARRPLARSLAAPYAVAGSGGGGGFVIGTLESQTIALLARFTTPATPQRQVQINTLISALVSSGVWDKLDAFYVLAAANTQAAQRNWVADSFNLSEVNAPAFVADRGYTGNGTTSYLETSFNPTTASSPKLTQDDAHMGLWSRTDLLNAAASSGEIGAQGNASIFRSSAAAGRASGRPNMTSSTPVLGDGAFPGHTMWTRSAAAVWEGYAQGVDSGGGVDVSAAASDASYRVCGVAVSNSFGVNQIAAAHFGSNFTAAEAAIIFSALNGYMVAVGAA